ncbi:MAG: two-component regulator propeller domain-containing protein, partial [Bacteroidota bacterium]
ATAYFCFLEDRNNNIWLGGNELTVGNRTPRPLPREFLSFTLAMDSIGRIWIASQNGGIRIIENEKIIDSLFLGNSSADISIRTMKTDFDGSMWIGAQEGLFHFRKQTLTRYTVKDGLPNNWIRSIYQDANGTLWIATDGGLAKRKNNRFYSYTVNNGLYSNTIHVILEDDRGSLWMSSNKGIFVVKKSDIELFDDHTIDRIPCTIYGEEDGMRSAEGNGSFQQGGWKMRDGTLWFATIKGVAIVDPDNLKNNTVVPPVHIEKIVSDGKEISAQSAFTLHYPVNDITFYFNALSFRVPSRVRYKYILEGFHTDWVDAGNQHRAAFTNLPSGDFVFRVIACNDDGVWNTTGASVSFSLPPPFWAAWWFSVIIGIIIFGSFAGLIRYVELKKVRRRIEQLEHEKALERERARISKDMHDEVGANLTKIAILSELAARNADDTPKHLRKITETSREVIDSMSQIIWAINPKNDKLENMAAYLREFISETFEMTAIRASISFSDELPMQSLSAEFRRNIFLTVKEAVNNIVKYSKATEIHAQLHVETGRLLFSISDNGIGFDVSNTSRFGNGLHNMKKRIEDIGGSFVIESAAGKGTIISISVQL